MIRRKFSYEFYFHQLRTQKWLCMILFTYNNFCAAIKYLFPYSDRLILRNFFVSSQFVLACVYRTFSSCQISLNYNKIRMTYTWCHHGISIKNRWYNKKFRNVNLRPIHVIFKFYYQHQYYLEVNELRRLHRKTFYTWHLR